MISKQRLGCVVLLGGALLMGFAQSAFAAEKTLSADEALRQFVKGNALYKQQDYSQAALAYETVLAGGMASGDLYYNLGNAYFKQDDLGRAVLNYARALRLKPRDADVKANYRFAVSLTGSGAEKEPQLGLTLFLEKIFGYWNVNELAIMALVLFFLGATAHVSSLFFSFPPGRRAAVWIVLMVILLGATISLRLSYWQGQAIVLNPASCRFEPRQEATVHFDLDPGGWLKILDREGSWVKVRRSDGKSGWVKREKIDSI